MLFETEAEYRAEITEVRTALKEGLTRKSYDYTSGGPGSGAHEGWSRDPQAAMEYLKLLNRELDVVVARNAGGSTSYVQFERAT